MVTRRQRKKRPRDPDAARRNTRLRFEQWAKNPVCEANTFSAVHNVPLASVAKADGLQPSFGQSVFAITRGDAFERMLFARGAAMLLEALSERQVLPEGASGLEDLRLRMNGGTRLRRLDEALEETRALIRRLAGASRARQREDLPAVVAGATLRIPRGVMLPEAILIVDVMAVRTDGERPLLRVGEVKTYPDRGGHTSAGELALARAQAGIYLRGLELAVSELGVEEEVAIDPHGFLVLTRPGSNQASVRPHEELTYQARRAERGFELLERAAGELPELVAEGDAVEEELLQAVQRSRTTYFEACLGFCDRARLCYERALAAGDPVVLGEDVARFLGNTTLHRLDELLDGAEAASEAERDLMRRIEESRAMVRR